MQINKVGLPEGVRIVRIVKEELAHYRRYKASPGADAIGRETFCRMSIDALGLLVMVMRGAVYSPADWHKTKAAVDALHRSRAYRGLLTNGIEHELKKGVDNAVDNLIRRFPKWARKSAQDREHYRG